MVPHDDSPLSARAQQAIKDGEDAWEQASSGNWNASSWWRIGTALTLLRQQTLHELGINVPRGGPYNEAFASRISDTKFATMEPVTRSNLLFLMEPEIRIVLDRLLQSWTPEVRARRTHPTTLAQHVRKELQPKPEPKPAKADPATKPAKSAGDAARDKEIAALRAALTEARAEIERLRQQPATAVLDWQTRGDTHRAQRGEWNYFIRRDGKRFNVAISQGRSLPDKLLDMPSLELAKAHCAEHAAAHPVSDAAEIARLRARVAALEAEPPKPVKPPLDPESEAARQIET